MAAFQKGKIDEDGNDFKREVYFQKGDIVLDPFCGSGTILVQANELGMQAVGLDVSSFNAHKQIQKIIDDLSTAVTSPNKSAEIESICRWFQRV